MTKKMSGILQISGVLVDVANPRPDTILIEDIAHNLAVESRFNGGSHWEDLGYAYSVAQHSVHVSDICPPEHRLCGLLHDAPEAYLKDLHPSVKALVGDGYKRLERIMWEAMSRKFNLPFHIPLEVKRADQVLLVTEGRDLLHKTWRSFEFQYKPLPAKLEVWSPQRSKQEFLARFYALI